MNILEQFDHPGRKQDKEHFVHLVQIALADGIIEDAEFDMLKRIGKKLGLTNPEIDGLLEVTKKTEYIPPYEFEKRFGQLYDVIKMVIADGIIDDNEMHLATRIGLKSGFSEQDIPVLLNVLITGIKNNEQEDDLFELFKKRRMVR